VLSKRRTWRHERRVRVCAIVGTSATPRLRSILAVVLALAASKLGEWFAQALRGSEARSVGVCFFWWEVRPLVTWPFWQPCLSLVACIYGLTWAAWRPSSPSSASWWSGRQSCDKLALSVLTLVSSFSSLDSFRSAAKVPIPKSTTDSSGRTSGAYWCWDTDPPRRSSICRSASASSPFVLNFCRPFPAPVPPCGS
jgi:hypothetical protein